MLMIKTEKGYVELCNRQNFSIVTDFGGEQTLSFDMPTKDEQYQFIKNETVLRYKDNEYLIKSINQRKRISTITAVNNLDDWKQRIHQVFKIDHMLFHEVMLQIMPKGWTVEDAAIIGGKQTLEFEGVSDYDILMNCKELYGIAFEYHTYKKCIKVKNPASVVSRGLYASEELNLINLEYKGMTSNFATRLYAYGKKTEIKDEQEVIHTDYVTFAQVNDGKPYIDNHMYSDKIITQYWQDNSITDPKVLYDEAVERLKVLAVPEQSYGCELYDISRVDERYRMLDFKLYDKILILFNGNRIEHQIIEYTEYPDMVHKNTIVLSSSFKKITGMVESMNRNIQTLDISLNQKEQILNEVVQNVDSNTARIKDTYSKGETDTRVESAVQQTKDEINNSIQRIEENDVFQDKRIETAEQQLTPEQIINTVSGGFYKKDETDLLYSSKEELSSELNQLKDSFTITLKEMSGFNFLYNSSGWNATNFWYGEKKENGSTSAVIGNIEGIKNNDTIDHTVSGSAFLMLEGKMCQDVKLMPNNKYTITCKTKKYLSKCTMHIIQGEQVETVFSYEEGYLDDEWHNHTLSFQCLSATVTIEIVSSKDNVMVSDIMLNDGEIAKTWTSNNDEIYAGNLKIDKKGIRIAQTDTDTETVIDANEFAVVYQRTGKKVVRVNKDTTLLQKVVAEDDLRVGTTKMIKRVNGLDIAVIEEETND